LYCNGFFLSDLESPIFTIGIFAPEFTLGNPDGINSDLFPIIPVMIPYPEFVKLKPENPLPDTNENPEYLNVILSFSTNPDCPLNPENKFPVGK
jgi:hypothetical protein